MERMELESLVQNLNDRVGLVEQLLPTLATRDDLVVAVQPLATRAELAAVIEPLATRAEMHEAIRLAVEPLATRAEVLEEGVRTRRHFDVVAERLETHIRIIAEGYVALREELHAFRAEVKADIAGLDRRRMRLEAR